MYHLDMLVPTQESGYLQSTVEYFWVEYKSSWRGVAGSLKVFLEGSGVLNRQENSFYIDGPPPGPLLNCTQEQYSSLMNPPGDRRSKKTTLIVTVHL